MRLAQRLSNAVVHLLLRLGRPRPPSAEEVRRQDFSTHPGGKALRFTERIRDAFRLRWLRLRR